MDSTVIQGSWRFALVSVASFSCWAFGGTLFTSEAALYLACAVVFLVFGSLAVRPAAGPGVSRGRFFLIFALAFVAYAAAWCGFWFALLDKRAEIFGSLAGAVLMALVFRFTLGRPVRWVAGAAVLFFWHTLGYFGGEWLFDGLGGAGYTLSKLGWGLGYGLGFGAGLAHCLTVGRGEAGAEPAV